MLTHLTIEGVPLTIDVRDGLPSLTIVGAPSADELRIIRERGEIIPRGRVTVDAPRLLSYGANDRHAILVRALVQAGAQLGGHHRSPREIALDSAEDLGREDARALQLDAHRLAPTLSPGESTCLVDGSQYAPSWRRLDGGSAAWELADAHEGMDELPAEILDAYAERLDEIETVAPEGCSIYWEDGCLFLSRESDEDDPMDEDEQGPEDEGAEDFPRTPSATIGPAAVFGVTDRDGRPHSCVLTGAEDEQPEQLVPYEGDEIVRVSIDDGATVLAVARMWRVSDGDEVAELRLNGAPVARLHDPARAGDARERIEALGDGSAIGPATAAAIISAAYSGSWAVLRAWETPEDDHDNAPATPTETQRARAWDALMSMWEHPDNAEDLNGGDVVELLGNLRTALGYVDSAPAADEDDGWAARAWHRESRA